MTTILSLNVHLWIPVAVIENDSVGAGQIKSNTSRARRQKKNKHVRVLVKVSDVLGSRTDRHFTVQTSIIVIAHQQHFLDQVQHYFKLTEQQYFVIICLNMIKFISNKYYYNKQRNQNGCDVNQLTT